MTNYPVKLGPKAREVFDTLNAAQAERAAMWLRKRASGESSQRIVDVLRWFALGARDVRVVGSLVEYRGAAKADMRNVTDAVVVIRPSSAGKWGKRVEHRVIEAP